MHILALIAFFLDGQPQAMAQTFADKAACERAKPAMVKMAEDAIAAGASIAAYTVTCSAASQPGKRS
jgi:hypothetical protein